MGIGNVNVARMVIDDINSKGGLLGRPVELFIEDSATDDDVARAGAAQLVGPTSMLSSGAFTARPARSSRCPWSTKAGMF